MPEAFVRTLPRTAEDWRRLWSFTADPYRTQRRRTREVRVGEVGIGGTNPVRIQSMTISDTLDTKTVVDEIAELARAGSEIVRVTAPNRKHAENLAHIKTELRRRKIFVPLVADIHFTPQAALIAAQYVEKVRINPGNYADRKHFKKWEYSDAEYAAELERLEEAFRPLVRRCRELGVAMRIGTNHGSLSDRILNRYGDTPAGMVESALEFVRICEHHDYRDIVLSMKASDVKVMVQAYRLLSQRMLETGMDYPFHLGVTEAGSGRAARVKSTIGIGSLLLDGIGDTLRVSLTEDSVHEIPVAQALCEIFRTAPAAPGEVPAEARISRVPHWDPYSFARRSVISMGRVGARLASDQPPRIELVVATDSAAPGTQRPSPDEMLENLGKVQEQPDLVLLKSTRTSAADVRTLLSCAESWRKCLPTAAQVGLELPAAILEAEHSSSAIEASSCSRLSVVLRASEVLQACPPGADFMRRTGLPLQYTLACPQQPEQIQELAEHLSAHVQAGRLPTAALALECESPPFALLHLWRRFLAAWPPVAPVLPVVLRQPPERLADAPVDAVMGVSELGLTADLGSLLVDGVGDAIQLRADRLPERQITLAREILQATRLRLTRADFIACPSCGRTQFDLQTTTERIQQRLRHLKGLKIAVMGCIVNGPGEMADADFGYVGSGPGRIDLYVGHERVVRNLSEAEAVERLVDLIRQHGRWVEPEQA